MPARHPLAVAALWAMLVPTPALAQANFRGTPTGGRSALMGNTGVVFGRDGAGPFLNPASISEVPDSRFSFSAEFVRWRFLTIDDWFNPGPVDTGRYGSVRVSDADFPQLDVDFLPSTLCLFLGRVLPGGDVAGNKVAMCWGTVEYERFGSIANANLSAGSELDANQWSSLRREDRRTVFQATYSRRLGDLTLGVALPVSYSSTFYTWSTSAVVTDNTDASASSAYASSFSGWAWHAGVIGGLTYDLGSASLGLAVHTPSVHALGGARAAVDARALGTLDEPRTDLALSGSSDGGFRSTEPFRVALGAGREGRHGSFELDMIVNLPHTLLKYDVAGPTAIIEADGQTETGRIDERRNTTARGVVDAAVGAEIHLTPRLNLLTGASTNFPTVRKGELDSDTLVAPVQERNHRVSLSTGLGSVTQRGELLFGSVLGGSWGEMLAVSPYAPVPSFTPVPFRAFEITLVLAGALSFEGVRTAVKDIGGAVKTTVPRRNRSTP